MLGGFMKKIPLMIFSLLLIPSQLWATKIIHTKPKIIYGEDNRVDVFESKNPVFQELSKSTAAMIKDIYLNEIFLSDQIRISGQTLVDEGMCSTERFSKQLFVADCSGFLVSEDTLVTAGHCVEYLSDCSYTSWVFDYKVESSDQKDIFVPQNSIYKCTSIISRDFNPYTKNDYAYVKLDRKVTNRRPLKFRTSGKVSVGDELVVIGHPTGLPTKIADGAKVRSVSNIYFMANLDTYGGNSGSAVFNVKTEEVEGILVRGGQDYIAAGSCLVSNVCADDDCKGEGVTHITNVADLISSK